MKKKRHTEAGGSEEDFPVYLVSGDIEPDENSSGDGADTDFDDDEENDGDGNNDEIPSS